MSAQPAPPPSRRPWRSLLFWLIAMAASPALTGALLLTLGVSARQAGLAMATLALIGSLVGWHLARALAQPLEELSQGLRCIDFDRPDDLAPLQTSGTPFGEIASICDAVNALLDRLNGSRRTQREAMHELDDANRDLALNIDDRDRQIAQHTEDLRRALDAANEAIHARDALLANTSHEIRTPLYGIVGSAELLRLRLTSLEDQRDADAILRSAEGLLQLINDLLDFSRINAGKLELTERPFSLVDEIRAAITAVQSQAERRKLYLRFDNTLADNDQRIGDALRVRQIALNLISNAVKFTEHGGVTIGLSEVSPGRIQLVVTDTGVGIADEDQGRIFRAFEQADASASRRFQGSGLGLAIVDRLVALMSGSVSLQSAIGKGTKFTLEIALPASAPSISKPADLLAPAAGFGGLKVLVVDDVELNRSLLSAQIARLGATAVGAADGFEALKKLIAERFDLVLLDIQMPGIDGYETAERMRSLPHGRNVRIVAVTANAQPSERDSCIAAGMNDYVSKPVRLPALQTVLADTVAAAMPA